MKPKKDKNLSIQINLYRIFDQISNPQHIIQYQHSPHILADQIHDLNTLLTFASTNYTQKAKNLLNITKQYHKSLQTTLNSINLLGGPLYQIPQLSHPELAYSTLKRSTTLELEQQNSQLDWRAVYTEYQLKFMESKNISNILDWQKCYNSQQRCIQIYKTNHQGHYFKPSSQKTIQIDLNLKIQNSLILWNIKKIIYHNNLHYPLLSYYQNQLMTWIREHHNNSLQQSQKHVLSLLYKSIDYIDVILLYIDLKKLPYNQNIDSSDMKNGILNLFDEQDMAKSFYLKGKAIKVCFMLPYSISPPSIIIRVEGLNVLKIEFTSKNQIQVKIKLKHKEQQMTIKKLIGSIRKKMISLQALLSIVHEVLEGLQTYERLVVDRADQFKMDIFLTNRTTHLILYLKSIDCVLLEEEIVQNQAIRLQIKHNISVNHISSSGLYIVFASLVQTYLPPLIVSVSPIPELLFKTANTQFGFINKLFKNYPSITFEEAMYHNHFLEQVQIHQQMSNWNVKLVYLDIYPTKDARCEWITYKFKQMAPKKVSNQNPIVKKDLRNEQSMIRDYTLHIRIHQNFKTVQFMFVTPNSQSGRSEQGSSSSIRSDMNRVNENEIPEKYFKANWRQYINRRNQSELLRNEYIDMDQLLKSTHYILNHLEFNRYIKGRSAIFRNQEMVQLMDS